MSHLKAERIVMYKFLYRFLGISIAQAYTYFTGTWASDSWILRGFVSTI